MAGWNPGSGTERPFQTKIMADINVTPMVDIMLVLLVIFMVTAPLLVAGVKPRAPDSQAVLFETFAEALALIGIRMHGLGGRAGLNISSGAALPLHWRMQTR